MRAVATGRVVAVAVMAAGLATSAHTAVPAQLVARPSGPSYGPVVVTGVTGTPVSAVIGPTGGQGRR